MAVRELIIAMVERLMRIPYRPSRDLSQPRTGSVLSGSCVVCVAAHPDDEVLGVGVSLLRHVRRGDAVWVVYTTDGAGPMWWRRLRDANETVRTRRAEAICAADKAGIPREQVVWLHFPDGGLARHRVLLQRRLTRVLRGISPDILYTHAVEGGHFDHDHTAYAVQAVARDMPVVKLYEWAEYRHYCDLERTEFDFVEGDTAVADRGPRECVVPNAQEAVVKQAMIDCHVSQPSTQRAALRADVIREVLL